MLQSILNCILDWSEKHKLELNLFKTKTLKICKTSFVDQYIDLNLGGVTLEESRKIKYLGIIVNQKMQWKEGISSVSSKILKILNGFF